MAVSETSPSVTAFFESYRRAFDGLDAAAIAEHFAYPGHMTSDTGQILLVPITAKPEWTTQIERLLGMYRAIGFSSARIVNLIPTQLSPRLVQAQVYWALYDAGERLLYDFPVLYTLVSMKDRLLISAISHNEIVRYQECVARLQSQHRPGSSSR
jgi:hypothetical protein